MIMEASAGGIRRADASFGVIMEIRIDSIVKKYGKKQVLRGISFSAAEGECIGIIGGNGCGKSTLLSILAGVKKANSGRFLADGDDLFLNPKKRSELIAYVPQGIPLLEELSALDNLRLWYHKNDLQRQLDSGKLKMLGIDEFLKKTVKKLSGGMKKRLAIGCCIANSPKILLLDEPTSALDIICKEQIREYLSSYKKDGGIILIATHDEAELKECDRLLIIRDGLVEQTEYHGDLKGLAGKF